MNDPERRRFVRIDDELALWYQPIDSIDTPLQKQNSEANQFAQWDNQIQSQMGTLKANTPKTCEILSLLNKKLNFLYQQQMLSDNTKDHPDENGWQRLPISISACGIGFNQTHTLDIHQALHLKLKLKPFDQLIETTASVISCDALSHADEGYRIGVNFTHLTSQQEDSLIQYIFQAQSAQLRKAKNDA